MASEIGALMKKSFRSYTLQFVLILRNCIQQDAKSISAKNAWASAMFLLMADLFTMQSFC